MINENYTEMIQILKLSWLVIKWTFAALAVCYFCFMVFIWDKGREKKVPDRESDSVLVVKEGRIDSIIFDTFCFVVDSNGTIIHHIYKK